MQQDRECWEDLDVDRLDRSEFDIIVTRVELTHYKGTPNIGGKILTRPISNFNRKNSRAITTGFNRISIIITIIIFEEQTISVAKERLKQ